MKLENNYYIQSNVPIQVYQSVVVARDTLEKNITYFYNRNSELESENILLKKKLTTQKEVIEKLRIEINELKEQLSKYEPEFKNIEE